MAAFEPLVVKSCAYEDDSDCSDSVTSSGYDSAILSVDDWSDSASEDEELMDTSFPDTMVFENTKAVANTIEYILSMPSLCDVEFVIGVEEHKIFGLKAIIASRNRKLYDMVKRQEEMESPKKRKSLRFNIVKTKSTRHLPHKRIPVVVDNFDVDVFNKLISFIHLGQVAVTAETVVGLMCASEEFDIPDLRGACWDFCFRCLNNGNISTIVKSSKLYSGREAADELTFKLIGMLGGPKTTNV